MGIVFSKLGEPLGLLWRGLVGSVNNLLIDISANSYQSFQAESVFHKYLDATRKLIRLFYSLMQILRIQNERQTFRFPAKVMGWPALVVLPRCCLIMLTVITGLCSSAVSVAQEELIYVAVEPCRIVNTRKATDGAIKSGSVRKFKVWGTDRELAYQGGLVNCPNPKGGRAAGCGCRLCNCCTSGFVIGGLSLIRPLSGNQLAWEPRKYSALVLENFYFSRIIAFFILMLNGIFNPITNLSSPTSASRERETGN